MRYRTYFFIGLFVFLITIFKVPSFAQEKDLNVNLSKDVGVAVFYFEFGTEQNYDVTITLPNAETVNQPISGSSGTITISDAMAGNYAIYITAEGDISVNARVELNNNKSTVLAESGVTISSSITGLMLYFVDGNIGGRWSDTGLGKINVTVTNPKNMQILHNVSVDGDKFLLDISDNIQEIEVYLVPASNAKIKGAGVSYTLPVVRELDADIILPDRELTNRDTAIITAVLGNDYTVEITDNKNTVYKEDLPAGEHEIEFPLNAMDNTIKVYVSDPQKNTVTYTCNMKKDIIAPTLRLLDSYDGMRTRNDEITVVGTVADADILYLNGKEIDIPQGGKFSIPCTLENVGTNRIVICAMDIAGNENTIIFNVERKKPLPITLLLICTVVPAVLILIVVLLLRKRMHQKNSTETTVDEVEYVGEEKKEAPQQSTDPEVEKKMQKRKRIISFISIGNMFLVIAAVFILTRVCFFETYVASGSMKPALEPGNVVIYNKLYYVNHDYNRGDIVCLWSDFYDNYIAKRIIGIPGDEIEFHDGKVFINGKICKEDYIPDGIETNSRKSFKVPEGHVFLLGDNREDSVDSRYWEDPYMEVDDIVGKYFGTIKIPFKR